MVEIDYASSLTDTDSTLVWCHLMPSIGIFKSKIRIVIHISHRFFFEGVLEIM